MNWLRALLSSCLCLVSLAAAPTTRPVFTNIAAPGTTRWAWPWAGLSGVSRDEVKPDLAAWRAFVSAVRDDKPLFREWSGPARGFKWWDANTNGFLLDAEGVTSNEQRTLARRLEYMMTITRSVRATAPRFAIGWYGDPSILGVGRTQYPWSSDLIGEAMANREAGRKLHALCDYIVIGSYYSDADLSSPARWTNACRLWADNARIYSLVFHDKPRLWQTMGFANVAWSRSRRPDENDVDYRLSLAPSREQLAELRETVGPYIDGWFVWCGEQDTPGEETRRMINGLLGGS
jgi:hypothetical protein